MSFALHLAILVAFACIALCMRQQTVPAARRRGQARRQQHRGRQLSGGVSGGVVKGAASGGQLNKTPVDRTETDVPAGRRWGQDQRQAHHRQGMQLDGSGGRGEGSGSVVGVGASMGQLSKSAAERMASVKSDADGAMMPLHLFQSAPLHGGYPAVVRIVAPRGVIVKNSSLPNGGFPNSTLERAGRQDFTSTLPIYSFDILTMSLFIGLAVIVGLLMLCCYMRLLSSCRPLKNQGDSVPATDNNASKNDDGSENTDSFVSLEAKTAEAIQKVVGGHYHSRLAVMRASRAW